MTSKANFVILLKVMNNSQPMTIHSPVPFLPSTPWLDGSLFNVEVSVGILNGSILECVVMYPLGLRVRLSELLSHAICDFGCLYL